MEKQADMEIKEDENEDAGVVFDFNNLTEGCISSILSLTSPRDACRSSLVSSLFKSAAESDTLWEKFLPSNCREIIASSLSSSLIINFSSKKELYCSLCDNPILIDGGLKRFSLEKWSGRKCFMLGAKDLAIVWGSIPKYWKWRAFPGSRFAEVAQLITVSWLEIRGKLETRLLSPKTFYSVYFVFKFVEGAYGFNHPPTDAVVKIVGRGDNNPCSGRRPIYWDPDGSRRRKLQDTLDRLIRPRSGHILQPAPSVLRLEGQFPQERRDGWSEIEMGHFFNDGGEEDRGGGEVQMVLTEINGGQSKGGLIVEGIELRPKENI